MIKPLIIANWKANPDSAGRAMLLTRRIEKRILPYRNVSTVIAPPFPYLLPVREALDHSKLGAQNVFWGDMGPYTGEVSWHQLKHCGVQYVIIGHSERKIYFNETDSMIAKKVRSVVEHGMIAVLCVGERERIGDEIPAVVEEQLQNSLHQLKNKATDNLVVAYEPIWAISTMPGARPDTPENVFRTKLYIRKILSGIFGKHKGEKIRIIYGGSVTKDNIASFLREGKMEGALVGGASLLPSEFAKIVSEAGKINITR